MSRLDAVADPIRLRIVRHLADTGPATLPELAVAAGVHLNTARPHVQALGEAGVLTRESKPPHGRGRPAVEYVLTEGWTPPTTDFLGLAELLGAALLRVQADREELRAIGLEWGRWLMGRPGAHDLEEELPLALDRLGFHSRLDGDVLRLSSCPCSLVLPGRPELLCELTASVVDGLLAGSGSSLRVSRRAHHPDE